VIVYAIFLYAGALLAGLGGITLVIMDWRSNNDTVQRWQAANPNDNQDGSYGQALLINEVVVGLVGTTWRRVVAVILWATPFGQPSRQ
jgi:hypothetical protein